MLLSVKSPSGGVQTLLQPGAHMSQGTSPAHQRGDWLRRCHWHGLEDIRRLKSVCF